ncbi:O-methyltransferase [Halegenticoccus soli]|uniref:O-methyltransferase n=1 Tax=Halegenticoccus soli TaxID=1985678 RepID=UPI000C6ED863|nr:O-methyltransferase [Halegenticoccus soli]
MVLPDDVSRFVRATGPEHDEIQAEMAAYARENGFPVIGPEAGGVLRLLARLTGAKRVFEFGSGYGYSAYWFLQGMSADGEVVLTEFDGDELAMAREFFERAGIDDRATFEEGDAVSIVDDYDGPFDLVLVDHQKHRYAEAFEKVRAKVRVGGAVVADNVMRGPIDFDALLASVEGVDGEGGDGDGVDEAENAGGDGASARADLDRDTRGIAAYLATVRADPSFETLVLPVGNGIAVSCRTA